MYAAFSVILKYLCLVVQCIEAGVEQNELADMSSDVFFTNVLYYCYFRGTVHISHVYIITNLRCLCWMVMPHLKRVCFKWHFL